MSRRVIESLVGLFVLLGMLGVLFLALKAANLGSFGTGDTYALTARFDNVGGLKPRAPVRSAGVTVGRVASITFDAESYQGVVQLAMQQGVHFPTDTSARILTSGLLGDQYIELDAGGDDTPLAPGDSIALTQSALVLENLVGRFISNLGSPASSTAASPGAVDGAGK